MKIVHITYVLSHGGIGTMLGQIANRQSLEHDVEIVVVSDIVAKEKLDVLNPKIKVHLLNRPTGSLSIGIFLKLNRILSQSNADIYHFHSARIRRYLYPWLWRKIKSKSCVTLHHVISGVDDLKESRMADFVHICAISENVQMGLKKYGNIDSHLVMNGIEVEKFSTKSTYRKNGVCKIVQIGRLDVNCKGQDILIKALAQIKENGVENWHATFLGGVGSALDYLQNLAQSLGVLDNISFIEPKSHEFLEKHLCDFDLFVHPARYEGFGLVVAEAMAAKVPVIISSLPAPMKIIENGECGEFFSSENVDELADKIKLYITGEVCLAKIERAYQRVSESYSINDTVKKYNEVYKTILKK